MYQSSAPQADADTVFIASRLPSAITKYEQSASSIDGQNGAPRFECKPYCGWTESISHHFETMGNTYLLVFTGVVPSFVGWCRISSIHSSYEEST